MAKFVYIKDLGKTFVYDDSGKLQYSVEGDKSTAEKQEPTGTRLKPSKIAADFMQQTGKDMAVDLATQIPLAAIPGSGALSKIARPTASLLSGFGLDRMLSPDKPVGDSATDAAFNTLVGTALPHAIENPPSMGQFQQAKGWGIKGIAGGLLNMLRGEPLLPEVKATTPVVRDAVGKFVSNKQAWEAYQGYKIKKNILGAFSNLAGFGANAGIDAAVNSPDKE